MHHAFRSLSHADHAHVHHAYAPCTSHAPCAFHRRAFISTSHVQGVHAHHAHNTVRHALCTLHNAHFLKSDTMIQCACIPCTMRTYVKHGYMVLLFLKTRSLHHAHPPCPCTPCTMHHAPCTVHHAPYNMHSKVRAMHHAPRTMLYADALCRYTMPS